MVNRVIIYLAAVVILAVTVQSKAVKEDVAEKSVAKSLHDFARDLYQNIADSRSDSWVVSPMSLASVMTMLEFAASGSTKEELRTALHQSADDSTTKQGYQSIVEALNEPSRVDVRLANKIFVDKHVELKKNYQQMSEKVFKSEVENVDFAQTTQAAKTINDWAAAETSDKIKNIVEPDDLSGAAAVVANAVYFKAAWRHRFNKDLTMKQTFHLDSHHSKQVDMMYVLDSFNYGTVPGVDGKYIELPYDSSEHKFNMIIVVPDEIDGIRNVERQLANTDLSELSTGYKRVRLHLPRFKTESTFDLTQTLSQMGVTNIFTSSANLDKLTDAPVNIDKFVQKAYINVDEDGTEAAAVTAGVAMARGRVDFDTPVELRVDRPFCYVIVYGDKRTVLFEGRVAAP